MPRVHRLCAPRLCAQCFSSLVISSFFFFWHFDPLLAPALFEGPILILEGRVRNVFSKSRIVLRPHSHLSFLRIAHFHALMASCITHGFLVLVIFSSIVIFPSFRNCPALKDACPGVFFFLFFLFFFTFQFEKKNSCFQTLFCIRYLSQPIAIQIWLKVVYERRSSCFISEKKKSIYGS